jgi:hypothetical protein
MRTFLWIAGVLASIIFLFTRTSDVFLGSTFLFYFLNGISIFVLITFSYFYYSFFENVTVEQLKSMRQKPSITWFGWFARNLNEWTTVLLVFSPYVLIFLSISKGLSFWFTFLSFLQTIAFVIAMLECMFMVFLFITVIYHWIVSKKRGYLV